MDAWSVLQALWLFLPAYVANMSPVFTSKIFPKWSRPIDGGRIAKDGKRMLGDGKTWRGLFGGGLFAGVTALLMATFAPGPGGTSWLAGWDFGRSGYGGQPIGSACEGCMLVSSTWYGVFAFGFVVGFFALVGDALESYVKRRTGRERGAPWFPFDQLDFVVFGIIGMFAAAPLLADDWVVEALTGDWVILTTILIGTPALHLLVNRIGYWLKLKEVPW